MQWRIQCRAFGEMPPFQFLYILTETDLSRKLVDWFSRFTL